MNPKNLDGLHTFKNDQFPEWYAYSNDPTGANIPVDKEGKATTWSNSTNIFHFTEAQENEIDEKITEVGYCVFKSTVVVAFSEWQIKK